MSIRIVPFTQDLLPAITRFSESVWSRPRDEAFYRWRYLDCPGHAALLALRDGECVAWISWIARTYAVGARRCTVRETFDWYCLPDLRGSGLGVRVMRALMDQGDPVLAIGGSSDTLALLPRLRWREIGTAYEYALPLAGASVAAGLNRRFGLPEALGAKAFDLTARRWFRPRKRHAPPGGRAELVPAIGDEVPALYRDGIGHALAQIPDPAYLHWLANGAPAFGRFVPIHFMRADRLVGWAMLRILGAANDRDRSASLVDLAAAEPDPALYEWMVSEAASFALEWRLAGLRVKATSPLVRNALKENRFLKHAAIPVHAFGLDLEPGPLHLMSNVGDASLLPYPPGEPTT